MARIIKTCKETLPACTLVGLVYHDGDRGANGTFSNRWETWFADGAAELAAACCPGACARGYVGAERMHDGVYEYWIGVLADEVGPLPAGFSSAEIPGGAYALAWIQGKDDPALYAMHHACMRAFQEAGLPIAKDPWYIERYACPRFTEPDENGEVILDYLVLMQQ